MTERLRAARDAMRKAHEEYQKPHATVDGWQAAYRKWQEAVTECHAAFAQEVGQLRGTLTRLQPAEEHSSSE
jgi:uncharacterized protein YukE